MGQWLTAKEYRKNAKKTKYGNKKVEHAGRSFASKLEAAVFDILYPRIIAGEITDFRQQHRVSFETAAGRKIYIPDFSGVEIRDGVRHFWEAKGFDPGDWQWKRLMWSIMGPGPLHVYRGNYRRPELIETIVPEGVK